MQIVVPRSVLHVAALRGPVPRSVLLVAALRGRVPRSVLRVAGLRGRVPRSVLPVAALRGPSSEVGSLIYTGGGRPPSKGLDFVRPFSRSADLERARLCPRLIKWFLRPSGSKRPFGVERDMLFILSGFLFYGVREKRRAVPSAVAFGAALLRVCHYPKAAVAAKIDIPLCTRLRNNDKVLAI